MNSKNLLAGILLCLVSLGHLLRIIFFCGSVYWDYTCTNVCKHSCLFIIWICRLFYLL